MLSGAELKLLKQTKFPPEFSQKVDMQKVNVEVMKKQAAPYFFCENCANSTFRWIAGKISEILGSEDDVVIQLCFNLLEGSRYVGQSLRLSNMCRVLTQHSQTSKSFRSS